MVDNRANVPIWLSPGLAERARALADGNVAPPTPRDAATVVLLRDAQPASGVEVYLLRRVETLAFAAGIHVFPGGSVDPDDARSEVGWYGPPPEDVAGVLAADVPFARALVCAAVRETFEESGVLFAGTGRGGVVDVSTPEWEEDRRALQTRAHGLASMLRRRGLVLRADLLRPWAHWITPEAEALRYDTRFFIASLPPGQQTRPVGGESDRTVWLRPEEALAQQASGQLRLLPPTAFTLAELADYPHVGAVFAAAARRDIRPVLPRVELSSDEARLLLPYEKGYRE